MTPRSIFDYIVELRSRLLHCLCVFAIIALCCMPFANYFYTLLSKPLLAQLPQNSQLIATALPATFFIPLKFSLLFAFIITLPFLFLQFWNFITPALYKNERKWLWLLLIFSTLLFYLGMAFAYFIVFPLLFKFFVQTTPIGVTLFPDITEYLNLTLQLFFAFGLAFEVPIIIVGLRVLNIIDINTIAAQRRYFIVAAFVVAMFITPPDVVSQSLLAIPLCLLFEIGLLASRFFIPNNLSHATSHTEKNSVSR